MPLLLLGNCFWRKGFEAAFGPDRMGEKGGYPSQERSSSGGLGGILDYSMNPEIIADEKANMEAAFLATPVLAISLPVGQVFDC